MANRYVRPLYLILVLCAAPNLKAADDSRFRLEVESGPVWQSRNDAQIPNSTGTKFSLRAIQGSGPYAFGRVTFDWALSSKQELSLLAAPLSIVSKGELQDFVLFDGVAFEAGPGMRATYTFNSYRVTYRYRFYKGDRWTWKIGITGKIRQAEIELKNPAASASYTDLGFVPLIHLDGTCRLAPKWKLRLTMDGLAAPQGRAFDVALKADYDISLNWTIGAGYRMLEGGADVDKVYTFAWLHYAVASLALRF